LGPPRVAKQGWGWKISHCLDLCVNISKTVTGTAKVTINDYQEAACELSIDTKIDDLG